MGIIDIPFTRALVSNQLILGEPGWTPCYLFAATPLLNRPLLFTLHTVHGAVYSRVPLSHLAHEEPTGEHLEPWGSLGERMTVIQHAYLKDYWVRTKQGPEGRYLMTFDWLPQGHFEEDPEQQKSMNLLALENGRFALLPNNMCLFQDAHFTGLSGEWPRYRRNTEYFLDNG